MLIKDTFLIKHMQVGKQHKKTHVFEQKHVFEKKKKHAILLNDPKKEGLFEGPGTYSMMASGLLPQCVNVHFLFEGRDSLA